jgi:hypothetical protein
MVFRTKNKPCEKTEPLKGPYPEISYLNNNIASSKYKKTSLSNLIINYLWSDPLFVICGQLGGHKREFEKILQLVKFR